MSEGDSRKRRGLGGDRKGGAGPDGLLGGLGSLLGESWEPRRALNRRGWGLA